MFLLGLLWGCSALNFRPDACQTNGDCVSAFGEASVCNLETGYCDRTVTANPRCTPVPENLVQDWPPAEGTVVIGGLFDGNDYWQGMAVMQAVMENLGDHQMAAVICDTSSDDSGMFDNKERDEVVPELTQYLVDVVGVPAIIGPNTNEMAKSAYASAEGAKTLFISPAAMGYSLAEIDGESKTDDNPGLFWRTVGSELQQAYGLNSWVETMNFSSPRVAVVVDQDYASSEADPNDIYIHDDLVFQLHASGVNDSLHFVQNGQVTDGGDVWALFFDEDVDAIVFISEKTSTNAAFLNSLVNNDLYDSFNKNIDLVMGPHALNETFLIYVPSNIQHRVNGFAPALPRDNSNNMFEEYEQFAFNQANVKADQSPLAAYAYDAVMMAAFGVSWARVLADEVTGRNIAEGLRHFSNRGGVATPLSFSGLDSAIEAFGAGQNIDIYGATGGLDFTEENEEIQVLTDIWQVQDGTEVTRVWQCDSSSCVGWK